MSSGPQDEAEADPLNDGLMEDEPHRVPLYSALDDEGVDDGAEGDDHVCDPVVVGAPWG